MRVCFVLLLSIVSWGSLSTRETEHGRIYEHGFVQGNLVKNWSFESETEQWMTGANSSSRLYLGRNALTGSYVGYFPYADGGLESDTFQVNPGTDYALSFYYLANSVAGVQNPSVRWLSGGQLVSEAPLQEYVASAVNWTWFQASLHSPANADKAVLIMAAAAHNGSGWLYVDDVVFEPGTKASRRRYVSETVSYYSGTGEVQETQARVEGFDIWNLFPNECLQAYQIYASGTVSLRDGVISYGLIGAGGQLDLAARARIVGDAMSGGNVSLADGSVIEGSLARAGALTRQSNTVIGGQDNQAVQTLCAIPDVVVDPGSQNLNVPDRTTQVLSPGKYGDIHVYSGAVLKVSTGNYDFRSLVMEPDVHIEAAASDGPVELRIRDNLHFADRNQLILAQGSTTNLVRIMTAQTGTLVIGNDVKLFGMIVAPQATVHLQSRNESHAWYFAKDIVLEPQSMTLPAFWQGVSGNGKYLVSGMERDALRRPVKQGLPSLQEMPRSEWADDPVGLANAYWDGSAADKPDAAGVAYFSYAYGSTGDSYGKPYPDYVASGQHASRSGSRLVADLSIPSDIENGSGTVTAANYSLFWSKNENDDWSLQWKNLEGMVVQTATSRMKSASTDPATWSWIISRQETKAGGFVGISLPPLALSNNLDADDFVQKTLSDANGRVVRSWDSDRGYQRYWRGLDGSVRLWQDDEQAVSGVVGYEARDALGRPTSVGTATLPWDIFGSEQDLQQLADLDSLPATWNGFAISVQPSRHWFYDEVPAGTEWDGLLPPEALQNTQGRLAAAVELNSQSGGVPGFTGNDYIVAEYYSYDRRGRVAKEWRYTGAVRDPSRRMEQVSREWDDLDRISKETWSLVGSTGTKKMVRRYSYDGFGRLSGISDGCGRNLVSMEYGERGDLAAVHLGEGTRMEYTRDIHGNESTVQAIETASGRVVWEERIGRGPESATAAGYDASQTRYDGRISREISSHADAVNGGYNARLSSYDYDGSGRLVQRDDKTYSGTGASALPQDPSGVAWQDVFAGDASFHYDDNGRMIFQTKDGYDVLNYQYSAGTHQLDRVSGSLSGGRDASVSGTFQYDLNGRLAQDASRGVSDIKWRPDGLVSSYFVGSFDNGGLGDGVREVVLYGPGGERAAEAVVTIEGGFTGRLAAVRTWQSGGGRPRAYTVESYGSDVSAATSSINYVLNGVTTPVGRVLADGRREFFVKDHRGSLVRTVGDDGSWEGNGWALRYAAYGVRDELAVDGGSTLDGVGLWTSQEQSASTGDYRFQYRSWDPELAVWWSPDPAREFANPYSSGRDPVNFIDKDGSCELICAAIIGAVIGAYLGGSAANDGNVKPWEWTANSQTYAGMLIGGILGGSSGGLIGAGGYAIGAGNTVLGSSLTGAGALSGAGFTIESGKQIYSGEFDPNLMMSAWGAGAAVGALGGALIGGGLLGSSSSFLESSAPYIPTSNGVVLGASTLGGGMVGAIGMKNTDEGFLRGGAAGLVSGATAIGAAYTWDAMGSQWSWGGVKASFDILGMSLKTSTTLAVTASGFISADYIIRGNVSDVYSDVSKLWNFGQTVKSKVMNLWDACVTKDRVVKVDDDGNAYMVIPADGTTDGFIQERDPVTFDDNGGVSRPTYDSDPQYREVSCRETLGI